MFNNPTNLNRVKLIGETLDKLEKSASSNRVTPDEVAQMLLPVLDRFAKIKNSGDQMRPQSEIISEAAMQPVGHLNSAVYPHGRPHNWTTIKECAENAPLKDLTVALAVYMNRVEELTND